MKKNLLFLVLSAVVVGACSGNPTAPSSKTVTGTFVARAFSLAMPPNDTIRLRPGVDTISISFRANGTIDGTARVAGGTAHDPIYAINRRMDGRFGVSGHYVTIQLNNYYAPNDARGLDGWVGESVWTWNGGDTIRIATPVGSSLPVVGYMVRVH